MAWSRGAADRRGRPRSGLGQPVRRARHESSPCARGSARVEHIGSTSVPGPAAKPIIDMLLIVDDADDEEAFVPALVAEGSELRVRERPSDAAHPGARCAPARLRRGRGGDSGLSGSARRSVP
ncbi:GrpB family protein [Streptomyces atratus]|uniref:GrpB family protein n=1 Tax=Streptomyces atratus TaxID=1893 RepID=UPI00364C0002